MRTFPITVKTKPVGTRKSKIRTYDAQVLELGEKTSFYITSRTKRDIKINDHFDLEDIISVTFDNHTYQTVNTDTVLVGKENVPVIETILIA